MQENINTPETVDTVIMMQSTLIAMEANEAGSVEKTLSERFVSNHTVIIKEEDPTEDVIYFKLKS